MLELFANRPRWPPLFNYSLGNAIIRHKGLSFASALWKPGDINCRSSLPSRILPLRRSRIASRVTLPAIPLTLWPLTRTRMSLFRSLGLLLYSWSFCPILWSVPLTLFHPTPHIHLRFLQALRVFLYYVFYSHALALPAWLPATPNFCLSLVCKST